MAHTVTTETGIATAEDGARLDWIVYTPTGQGAGPFPAILLYTSSGFTQNDVSTSKNQWLADCADNGIIGFAPTVRLAQHNHWIPGQTVNGIYPTQYNDVKRSIKAARADSRVIGSKIMVGGGSGGACIAASALVDDTTHISPVAWTAADRPIGGVFMSGLFNFADRTDASWSGFNFFMNVTNIFTNTADDTDGDRVIQLADSVKTLVTSGCKPMWLIYGTADADNMPPNQSPLMAAALTAAGVTNFQITHTQNGHAYANYTEIGKTAMLAYMNAIYAGTTPPPPPDMGAALTTSSAGLSGQYQKYFG